MRRPEPWRAGSAHIVAVPFVALTLIVGCGGDDEAAPTEPPEPPVATTVNISPASVALSSFGETLQLTAAVADQNGQAMAGPPVSWTTSDNSVATVSAGGLVTAARNGTATVTATSGSAAGTASVTVAQRAARVDVLPASVEISSFGRLRAAHRCALRRQRQCRRRRNHHLVPPRTPPSRPSTTAAWSPRSETAPRTSALKREQPPAPPRSRSRR